MQKIDVKLGDEITIKAVPDSEMPGMARTVVGAYFEAVNQSCLTHADDCRIKTRTRASQGGCTCAFGKLSGAIFKLEHYLKKRGQ